MTFDNCIFCCVLCGNCACICSFGAVEVKEGRRFWDEPACMGCGLCVEHCPKGALSLIYNDEGGFILPTQQIVRFLP